jgi:hypothetical protein
MDFEEIEYEGVDWIEQVRDILQCRALVDTDEPSGSVKSRTFLGQVSGCGFRKKKYRYVDQLSKLLVHWFQWHETLTLKPRSSNVPYTFN